MLSARRWGVAVLVGCYIGNFYERERTLMSEKVGVVEGRNLWVRSWEGEIACEEARSRDRRWILFGCKVMSKKNTTGTFCC